MDMIYAKTPVGQQELKERSRKLPAKLRFLLVMVDGNKSAQVLLSALAPMGVTLDSLKELELAGLIVAVERPRTELAKIESGKLGHSLKHTFASLGLTAEGLGEMLAGGLIDSEESEISNSEKQQSTNTGKS